MNWRLRLIRLLDWADATVLRHPSPRLCSWLGTHPWWGEEEAMRIIHLCTTNPFTARLCGSKHVESTSVFTIHALYADRIEDADKVCPACMKKRIDALRLAGMTFPPEEEEE